MALLTVLIACQPGVTSSQGVQISPDYFPMDGEREARFVNEDTTIDWLMVMEKVDTVVVDGVEIVTWDYSVEEGNLLATVEWSASSGNALQIHGWSEGTGEFTTFDTPVAFTDENGYVDRNEAVVTETNGYTFTATYLGVEGCPVAWGPEDWDCAHFTLDDGDGDPMAGPFFAGEYWFVPRYTIAWMILTGWETKWDLVAHDWCADGDTCD